MQDVTNFIQMLMSDPKLALGVVAFCGAMALLVLVLWVLRIMRRRREQASGLPAMTADQMRQYAQPPIFTTAINGASGAGSMSHRSVDELLAAEDSLMALRELYQRKLIPADVYIKESQKYSQSL
jgi:hypothetical protein